MLSNHLLDWIILILLLLLAVYAMVIIGAEGKTYKEESKQINFNSLEMLIPKWWSILSQDQNSIIFHRTDTRYDWKLNLTKIISNDINQYLSDYIDKEEIVYDESETQIETDSINKILVEESNSKIQNFIYVEGTATEKINDRIYLELVLIHLSNREVYFFQNKSSVLNGAIEGPYFDELIKSLKISF